MGLLWEVEEMWQLLQLNSSLRKQESWHTLLVPPSTTRLYQNCEISCWFLVCKRVKNYWILLLIDCYSILEIESTYDILISLLIGLSYKLVIFHFGSICSSIFMHVSQIFTGIQKSSSGHICIYISQILSWVKIKWTSKMLSYGMLFRGLNSFGSNREMNRTKSNIMVHLVSK